MQLSQLICGVDEAGRGPLAGSVYAAAVILDPSRPIAGLADSKKISEKKDKIPSVTLKTSLIIRNSCSEALVSEK